MKIKRVWAVLLAGAMAASLVLGGCGNKIDADATVATVSDQEISLGYAAFVAHYTQANYDSMFVSYYGEDYWTNESYADSDGKNMQESVKDYVMEEIELQYLMEQHMDEYGVEITDEDREAIRAAAEEFMSENSKEAIKAMGATQEYVENMLYYQTVESRMSAAIEATADTQVSEEECARRTFSYIRIDTANYTDEDGSTVSYTDDEKEELVESIPEIAKEAKADFEGTADEHAYAVSTYSYGSDEASEEDGGFCDAVIAAADDMAEGQISDAIEGTDCYYIIRLDSENDEEAAASVRESIIQERQDNKYTEVTDAFKEESDFELKEDEWAKVEFSNLFTLATEETGSTDDELSVEAE